MGTESYSQKSIEKEVFSMLFRVRLFGKIQGARSRGLGRKVKKRPEPSRGSSRTLWTAVPPPNTWVFPGLSSQRGSPYNTLEMWWLSRLGLGGGAGTRLYRAVAPKGLREGAGSCR